MELKLRIIWLLSMCSFLLGLASCKKEALADGAAYREVGLCSASDRKLVIHPNNKEFTKNMDKCSTDAWGNSEKTTKCLKTHYPKLSDGCAKCYGEMASCGASHCKWKCFTNHFSEGCLACVNQNCRDIQKNAGSFSLIKCTGLKANELP